MAPTKTTIVVDVVVVVVVSAKNKNNNKRWHGTAPWRGIGRGGEALVFRG